MLLIITPKRGLLREIEVFRFIDATEARMFEALQAVNEYYDGKDKRHEVNITLVPISMEQLPDWIDQNVEPNWFELLLRRYRYSVTTLARAEV